MKTTFLHRALLLVPLLLLCGCPATQSGRLEVLNPKQAYGRTVAIVGDLHGENAEIEKRLASDLQKALAKRGLAVAENPVKADIVIVPTLGRMRERSPSPGGPADPAESGQPVEPAEPVVAAPAAETRPFNRLASGNAMMRGDLISRRSVPSARTRAGAQQAGLLLTGYRGEDFRDYGTGRQSLPPVWRIYVSQPAVQMNWNAVAVPLINAAANAAKPLGKSVQRGAGSGELETKPESATGEAPAKKRKLSGLFGRPAEKPESAPAGNRNQATGDRPE